MLLACPPPTTVEDSLLLRQQHAARLLSLSQTVEDRRRALQRAESLQREGQIDLLVLLDMQRSVLASELALSAYFSPSWTVISDDCGRHFSGIVDAVSG